jgi:hypothetical protein
VDRIYLIGGGVFIGGLLECNVESKFQKSGKFLGCLCHCLVLKRDFCPPRSNFVVHSVSNFSGYFSLKLTEVGDLLLGD